MSAAITTRLSAMLIVWLSPTSMAGRASGNRTFVRICRSVAPDIAAASINPEPRPRMPRSVARTIGGSAKINVASSEVTAPMLKRSVNGIR